MILAFTIDGPPVPKARARTVAFRVGGKIRSRSFTPEKTAAYEKRAGLLALNAVNRSRGWRKDWGAYALTVRVYREARRGDLDNFVKAIGDACNGVAYTDDAAVVRLAAEMHEDRARPRVEVEIAMLGEETAEQAARKATRERAQSKRIGRQAP